MKQEKDKEETPELPDEKPFEFFGGDEREGGWNDQDRDFTLDGKMP